MDVAMPLVIARAKDFGLIGTETVNELNHNNEFFTKMERVRLAAGQAMGMGDCSKSVTPKFGLMAPHKDKNHVIVRYFMPWKTHPSMAVTGGQCLASCGSRLNVILKSDASDAQETSLVSLHAKFRY